jgi:metal-dependent amidase/aminoacylase/carboxypeptidase family protein
MWAPFTGVSYLSRPFESLQKCECQFNNQAGIRIANSLEIHLSWRVSICTQAHEEDMLVCTVGELQVWPGASNVIAGQTQLSVDIRAKTDALRSATVEQVMKGVRAACKARGTPCEVRRTHDAPAVASDPDMITDLTAAIRDYKALLGLSVSPSCGDASDEAGDVATVTGSCANPDLESAVEVPVIVSGAGHDALAVAEVAKVRPEKCNLCTC